MREKREFLCIIDNDLMKYQREENSNYINQQILQYEIKSGKNLMSKTSLKIQKNKYQNSISNLSKLNKILCLATTKLKQKKSVT